MDWIEISLNAWVIFPFSILNFNIKHYPTLSNCKSCQSFLKTKMLFTSVLLPVAGRRRSVQGADAGAGPGLLPLLRHARDALH